MSSLLHWFMLGWYIWIDPYTFSSPDIRVLSAIMFSSQLWIGLRFVSPPIHLVVLAINLIISVHSHLLDFVWYVPYIIFSQSAQGLHSPLGKLCTQLNWKTRCVTKKYSVHFWQSSWPSLHMSILCLYFPTKYMFL